jgi:hypothetical protein
MLLPLILALQGSAALGTSSAAPSPAPTRYIVPLPTRTSATAARATTPPVLDGRDDDDIWRDAPAITEFRQHDPVEDGDPRFRTEARVGYDAKHLYLFVRAFDPRPDSIMAFLSRRDGSTKSDYIHLMVDGYRDRRTGFRFTVNPLGVKRDIYHSNDHNEDASWDGVWDVSTKVDSLGWTAEYRIPLSQIRYPEAASNTFGFAIWRDIARFSERISWPLYRRSQQGFVSQWGEVSGFDGLVSVRRLEVMPYTVATNQTKPEGPGEWGREQKFAFGADVKFGITSNLTLDGAINPDFGQVEADPAQLNLTAFELFQQERRPFFLEGAGTFGFAGSSPFSPGVFYSRRIGRAPQLGSGTNSTILGAAKVTGRTSGGLNVGFLNAFTQREVDGGNTIEPATNYMVTRLAQDLRNGNSGVGVLLTATNRMLEGATENSLRENAYVLGLDGRHRFGQNNKYQVSASAITSYVNGTAAAITATQRNSAHYYQRVGSALEVDPTATSLTGTRLNANISKNGGGIWRFGGGVTTTSAGYEVNDLGFMNRADMTSNNQWLSLQLTKPTKYYRQMFVNLNQGNDWNTEGQRLGTWANMNVNGQLLNQWYVWGGWNVNNIGRVYDDRAARGGPSIRRNLRNNGWLGFETDARAPIGIVVQGYFVMKDAAGSSDIGMDPSIRFRVASRVQANVGFGLYHTINDQQWYLNETDGLGTHYAFAHMDQKTASMTARVDYTMTPTLSLQVYAQPFMSSVDYSDPRELVDPDADRYADRYASYAGTAPTDFYFMQFRSNTLLRWEYRPGSVLFFVWQQGRNRGGADAAGFEFGRGFGELFDTRSDNTFLIKGSYWFSR